MWKTNKRLYLGLLALFSFAPILLAANVQAICSGDRCNNGDPKENGCEGDAYTFSKTVGSYSEWLISHDITVELRYSPKCQAVWTKAGRLKEKDSTIWVQTADGNQYNHYSPARDGTYYTDMRQKETGTKACAKVGNQTWCTGGMP